MIAWSRRRTLIAGLALILASNAVALLGPAWNRSGEPESTLRLTQRELTFPNGRYALREDSGMALQLHWRVAAGDALGYPEWGGFRPRWLDQNKLAELGFDLAPEASSRQVSRDVLLVLEFDGPTYRQALEAARQSAAAEAAKSGMPGDGATEQRRNAAQSRLEREEKLSSRLFVVDAGLDASVLRQRHADRTHYAIVRGRVRLLPAAPGAAAVFGMIAGLDVDHINVPHEFQPRIDARLGAPHGLRREPPALQFSIAFGRRHEPWLADVGGIDASTADSAVP